jgi:hypothetical protein
MCTIGANFIDAGEISYYTAGKKIIKLKEMKTIVIGCIGDSTTGKGFAGKEFLDFFKFGDESFG